MYLDGRRDKETERDEGVERRGSKNEEMSRGGKDENRGA